MISLQDKQRIQEQQRIDTAREVLERLNTIRPTYSDTITREFKRALSQVSKEFLGSDIFSDEEGEDEEV